MPETGTKGKEPEIPNEPKMEERNKLNLENEGQKVIMKVENLSKTGFVENLSKSDSRG